MSRTWRENVLVQQDIYDGMDEASTAEYCNVACADR
jgi:hypothetical protein